MQVISSIAGENRLLLGMVLLLAPIFCHAAQVPKPAGGEKNEPLVMENADRFEGYRSRGEYVLSGKVRFRHGTLSLETERAVWLKDKNIVYCESGMKIVQRGAVLTADRGNYDKNLGEASAEGHVSMRDSSGEVEASGRNIVYKRYQHLATLMGDPELKRYYAIDPVVDSLAAGPLQSSGWDSTKTLIIRGGQMTYNDSSQVAVADGNVRINRDKLKITCHKAEYHDAADSLFLLGEPMVIADDNQVKGTLMRLGMHREEIRSLLVKGNAQARSVEPATDSTASRQSEVNGDSLFLVFKDKAIDSVQVFKNATGTYYDVDRPEFVNKMSGSYMVLRFVRKQVSSANVVGGARSTYYHFEEKRLKGRNEAEGDTIDFAFKSGRIEEVMVKGLAKGTYFGERQLGVKSDSVATADTSVAAKSKAKSPPSEPGRKK